MFATILHIHSMHLQSVNQSIHQSITFRWFETSSTSRNMRVSKENLPHEYKLALEYQLVLQGQSQRVLQYRRH